MLVLHGLNEGFIPLYRPAQFPACSAIVSAFTDHANLDMEKEGDRDKEKEREKERRKDEHKLPFNPKQRVNKEAKCGPAFCLCRT